MKQKIFYRRDDARKAAAELMNETEGEIRLIEVDDRSKLLSEAEGDEEFVEKVENRGGWSGTMMAIAVEKDREYIGVFGFWE